MKTNKISKGVITVITDRTRLCDIITKRFYEEKVIMFDGVWRIKYEEDDSLHGYFVAVRGERFIVKLLEFITKERGLNINNKVSLDY